MNIEQVKLIDGTKLTRIDLGRMSRKSGETLAAKFNGSAFMDFQIIVAPAGGECVISIQTDYNGKKDDILGMVLFILASECAK